MKHKRIILPLISILMLFGLAGMASAWGGGTVTCDSPTTFDSSNTWINFTVTGGDKVTNCTAQMQSASTQNSSWATVGTNIIDSFNASEGGNGSVIVTVAGLIDSNDYQVRGRCVNSSGAGDNTAYCTTLTSKTVNNSLPKCVFASSLTSSSSYPQTQTWSVDCGNSTTAPTITFGSNSALTMTRSAWSGFGSKTCTYTGTQTSVPKGTYSTVSVSTTDGTESTSCSLSYVTIDPGVPLKEVAAVMASEGAKTTQTTGGSNSNLIWIIVLAGLGGYWYVRNKKGK